VSSGVARRRERVLEIGYCEAPPFVHLAVFLLHCPTHQVDYSVREWAIDKNSGCWSGDSDAGYGALALVLRVRTMKLLFK
jgi:hypothetical protein